MKGVGKTVNGLYYLLNESIDEVINHLKVQALEKLHGKKERHGGKAMNSQLQIPAVISNITPVNAVTLWHQRLGHGSLTRISKISGLIGLIETNSDICVTYPIAKFTKMSYKKNTSRAKCAFDLVHIDTWRPYRVNTRGNHRFFLTVVDDY